MPKRTNELVHEMPLTKTVRLKFRRVGVEYNASEKKSEFKYQLTNWPAGQGDAPIVTIGVNDWDDEANRPKRHKLKDDVEKNIDNDIMTALVAQLSS